MTLPDEPLSLLEELTSRGIELRAEGDRLLFRPAAAMTPELVSRLRCHKYEVMEFIANTNTNTANNDAVVWSIGVDSETVDASRTAEQPKDTARRFASSPTYVAPHLTEADRIAIESLWPSDSPPRRELPLCLALSTQPDRDKNGETAVERAERWRRERVQLSELSHDGAMES